jgi:hypothetical protein
MHGKPFPQKSYNHHHGCYDGVRIRQDSQPNCGAKGEVHRYLVLQALLQNGKHTKTYRLSHSLGLVALLKEEFRKLLENFGDCSSFSEQIAIRLCH